MGRTQSTAEPEEQKEEEAAPAAAAAEGAKENVLPAGQTSSPDEGGEAAAQNEAPVEEADSAPADEVKTVEEDKTEQQASDAASVHEEVKVGQVSKEDQEEQMLEEVVTGSEGEPKKENLSKEVPPVEAWEEEALEEELPFYSLEEEMVAEEEADDGEEQLKYNFWTDDECK